MIPTNKPQHMPVPGSSSPAAPAMQFNKPNKGSITLNLYNDYTSSLYQMLNKFENIIPTNKPQHLPVPGGLAAAAAPPAAQPAGKCNLISRLKV
jgi:hypothetical protein